MAQTLEDDLANLNRELNEYSFNTQYLSDEQKKEITDFFVLLKKTMNNKIFIENIEKQNIKVNNNDIIINGNIFASNITKKNTLHFINCRNLIINIYIQVTHITLEKCENINIRTTGGSISGLDCISCNNVSHIFDNGHVYFIDISKSTCCRYYLSKPIALNTIIQTMESMDLKFFAIENHIVTNIFHKNNSFFDIFKKYIFKENNGLVQICDVSNEAKINNYILPVFLTNKNI